MANQYDVIVIGGGPGGYVCAIRAAQNGLKTACVDNWVNLDGQEAFGGTCLNAGCIPSKALLESSEWYHKAQHEFAAHGISAGDVSMDVSKMQARRAGIVKQLTGGIAQLFKANGVDGIRGTGRLLAGGKVQVTDAKGKKTSYSATNVVVATGSTPVEIPSLKFDGEDIIDSWKAIELPEVPPRLGVIGAGVIGLELGSVWNRLGSEVVVLEAMDDFLALADQTIAKDAARQFKKQGLDIRLGAMVTGATKKKDGVHVSYKDKSGEQSIVVDKLIVAVGRRPVSDVVLEKMKGIATDKRGFVEVDGECRTKVKGVWAIGDCVRGAMLAHKASEEGVMVADLIAGKVGHVNYDAVPSIIYTHPELAWVGKTEEQCKAEKREIKVGSFGFAANGRAKAMEAAAGSVKMIADAKTDELLGVHIVGPMASELIQEAVLAIEFSASTEDLQRTIHGHPTLAEAMHEAALAVDGRAIHAVNKKR
jgi:dihydrolipoyl dehydrogenase